MSKTIVTVPSDPQRLPCCACAMDGPYLLASRLRLWVGEDEIEVQVRSEMGALWWLEAVLRDAADHVRVAAEEISRELQEEA